MWPHLCPSQALASQQGGVQGKDLSPLLGVSSAVSEPIPNLTGSSDGAKANARPKGCICFLQRALVSDPCPASLGDLFHCTHLFHCSTCPQVGLIALQEMWSWKDPLSPYISLDHHGYSNPPTLLPPSLSGLQP